VINDWSQFWIGHYRDENSTISFGVWHRPCVPTKGVWLLPQENGWIFQAYSARQLTELMSAVENHVCPEGDVGEGIEAAPNHSTIREIIARMTHKYGSDTISQSYSCLDDLIWGVWDTFRFFSEEKRQVWTETVERALLDGDY